MKDIIALIILVFSVVAFESTLGCATMEVNTTQTSFSKAISGGDSTAIYWAKGKPVPINFPFPRTRYDFIYAFSSSTYKSFPPVLCIADLPFSLFFDLFLMPFDIYGTATGWYDSEYAKPKPLASPSNAQEEKGWDID